MPAQKPTIKFSFWTWFLIFMGAYFAMKVFFPAPVETPSTPPLPSVVLQAQKNAYTLGEPVVLKIKNETEKTWSFEAVNPVEIYHISEDFRESLVGEWTNPTGDFLTLAPLAELEFSFAHLDHQIFAEAGNYSAYARLHGEALEGQEAERVEARAVFAVEKRGFFGWIWETCIYNPIFNALVWLTSVLPSHNLGWGIVILTLVIRLILFFPNQKMLRSQRAMQEIQPLIKEIQRKYASDPQMLSRETFALWKKYKINPLGSLVMPFIQIPILIGLFYVIQSANSGFSSADIMRLYGGLASFDLSLIGTMFYSLDLTTRGVIWLAVLVALLQFFQMWLMQYRKKKKAKISGEGIVEKQKEKGAMEDAMATTTKTMMYVMPFMIGFAAYSFPVGVGFYWGVNTIIGILQQLIVNRQRIVPEK